MNNLKLGFDKVYVISLPKRQDRRERVKRLLNGIDFEFIDAIDGYKDIDIQELIETEELSTEFKDPVGLITKGIVGCALSHKKAWKRFLDSKKDISAVFFEDDFMMTSDIFTQPPGQKITKESSYTQYYTELLDEINIIEDWDVIFLGKKKLKYNGERITDKIVHPEFGKSGWGAHSYVLNRKSAKKLLDLYSPIDYAVDVFLETNKCYSVNPSLFRQESDSLLYGKYKINDTEIDSDTFNNHLEGGERPPQTNKYASFGGYVEDFVESCQFTNFDGSPFLMTSEQASNLFADNSLDFVYIDGNHKYEYVLQDLNLWYPKVKQGGYLMGDDYLGYDKEWWYKSGDGKKDKILKKDGKVLGHFGVNSAVNEFTLDKGIELNQLDDKLDKIGGITNSKKMDVWWGEWYFRKQELTERKEPGGFVQWRKELQNG